MRKTHGMTGTRVHSIWMGMHDRCRNDRQGTYGSRGIRVCDRWSKFECFFEDMGHPPSQDHSIDRLDVRGDYEPGNCRWATRVEQARNTTRNTVLEHDGRSQTIAAWSEDLGIKPTTICRRRASGWSVRRTLTEPVLARLPKVKPWQQMGMSRSSWYRAGRPTP